MTKKTAATAEPQAPLNIAGAGDDAADRLAAEAAVTGVLLRRECIAGKWYPHGALLTCAAPLARALEADSAIDLHPAAVEHARQQGAVQLVHAEAQPDAE